MSGLSYDPVTGVLAIPLIAAAILALLPDYRLAARINVAAAFATLVAAVSLFAFRPAPGNYIVVDDLNIVFVVLSTFVGFTTAIFSASYIAHEVEIGRLTPTYLRFYHAMYQALMFAMNLALVANNIGLMWVAIEIATLTTVLMVGIYRTHRRSKRRGNTSSSARSASRSRSSAPSSSTWRRSRWWVRASRRWCGRR